MKVQSSEFITSVGAASPLPITQHPQIVLVGRSNVGKSTLINALARRKVARAGGAPGTTRLLNVYQIALDRNRGTLVFIDLPGYGYARGGAANNRIFDQLTARYFHPDPTITHDRPGSTGPTGAVLLVDARHPGLQNDLDALTWLTDLGVPLTIAATKIDRLTRSARGKTLRAHETALAHPVLPISAKLGEGLPTLWTKILNLAGI